MLIRCWKGAHCLSAACHFRSVHRRLQVNNGSQRRRSCAQSHNFVLRAKETKFVGNKTAIYDRNRTSLCPLLVKLARLSFVSFLRSSDRSRTQEQAGSMPLMTAVAPSPSHNRDCSEKVRTFYKRTHRHKTLWSPKIRRRVVVTQRSTARSCRSMSSYGRVLAVSWNCLLWRHLWHFFCSLMLKNNNRKLCVLICLS